jgi:hypothetical protein
LRFINSKLLAALGLPGIALTWLLAVLVIGTLATATVGAFLAVIPVVELIGLLFFPFPTALMYISIVSAAYLLIRLPIRNAAGSAIGLIAGLSAAYLFGTIVPAHSNREFDAQVSNLGKQTAWHPIRVDRVPTVKLVRSTDTGIDDGCESFCLTLLLTGRAENVQVVTENLVDRLTANDAKGTTFQLVEDADKCLASLPSFMSERLNYPSDPVFRAKRVTEDFKSNLLDNTFESQVKSCIQTHENAPRSDKGWTFVMWNAPFDDEAYDRPVFSVQSRARIVDNRQGSKTLVDTLEVYGTRISSPLWIWPYGGNAGSGGTFSPVWAREHLDWDGPEDWWEFVEDSDVLAKLAIERLDRATVNAEGN